MRSKQQNKTCFIFKKQQQFFKKDSSTFIFLFCYYSVVLFSTNTRVHVCHNKNTNASRRQEFFRHWTVSLELSACCITWQRYLTCTV